VCRQWQTERTAGLARINRSIVGFQVLAVAPLVGYHVIACFWFVLHVIYLHPHYHLSCLYYRVHGKLSQVKSENSAIHNFYRVHLCINYFYRAVIWFGNRIDGCNRTSKGSPKISECLVRKLSGEGFFLN